MGIKIKRFDKIIAFEKGAEVIGFHTTNMEVAHISREVFTSGFSAPGVFNTDASSMQTVPLELQQWNDNSVEVSADLGNSKIKSLNINVTQICNLHCAYCAAGGDGTYGDPVKSISIEKTLPQVKFFMDKLDPEERFHVSFLGGEPLLYPQGIRLICEYVQKLAENKKLQISFKITTNGTIWNSEIEQILKTFKPSLVISMDGPPEINDLLRPQKNGTSSSAQILQTLNELQKIRSEIGILGVHAVFSEENLQIEKAYLFFNEFNFDFIDLIFSVFNSYSENGIKANDTYIAQMEKVAELAWIRGGEKELRKIYIFDHYFDLLDDQRRLENHCGLGKTLAVIDSRNRIFNCPWTVGKIQDQIGQLVDGVSDQTELFSNKLSNYKESIIERNNCQTCWAKYMCGGGCSFVHNTTNNKNGMKKSELFCERTKYLIALSLYYFSKSRELMT